MNISLAEPVWQTMSQPVRDTLLFLFSHPAAATYPLKIVVFALSGISMLAMIKGEGKIFKNDERTQKLSGIAFRYAWLGMMMSVAALIGIESFYPAKLAVSQILSIMGAAVLIIPFVLLQYFERKGDAQ